MRTLRSRRLPLLLGPILGLALALGAPFTVWRALAQEAPPEVQAEVAPPPPVAEDKAPSPGDAAPAGEQVETAPAGGAKADAAPPATEPAAGETAPTDSPAAPAAEGSASEPPSAPQEPERAPEPESPKAQAEPVQEDTSEERVIVPSGSFRAGDQNATVLSIDSRPQGARIFVDGEEKGVTPANVAGLSDGPHEIVFYLSGFGAHRQKIEGKGGRVFVDLQSQKATGVGLVTVITQPADARIDVDGQRVGLSPLEVPLEAGRHTIHVSAAGFKDADLSVDVEAEAQKRLDLALEPKDGTALVLSNPPGAEVKINGQKVGQTWEPLLVGNLKPGQYAIEVSKEGYRAWEKSDLEIRSDRTTTVLAALLPERDYTWVRLYTNPVGARVWLDGDEQGVAGEDGLGFKTSKGAHSLRLEIDPSVKAGYQPLQMAVTFTEDQIDYKANPVVLPAIDENLTHAASLIERGLKEDALGFLDRVAPEHPSYAQARLQLIDVLKDLGRIREIPGELAGLLARAEYQNNPTLNLAMGYWSLAAARDAPDSDASGLLARAVEALDRAAQNAELLPRDAREALVLKAHYYQGIASEVLFDLTGDKKYVKKGGQAWEVFFAHLDLTPKALEDTWIEKARRHRQSLDYLAKKLGG